jgi:hypothetical protein
LVSTRIETYILAGDRGCAESDMVDMKERIADIEREIRETPYNKATEHHIGKLKAKLSRLKEEVQERRGGAGGGRGFAVKKSGDASVALVGFPSVGKSTLLNCLTNAESEVADYQFTTINVVPGMMEHRGARIQILDMPGLIQGTAAGKGRGLEILSAVRAVDLILFVIDGTYPGQLGAMLAELEGAGVRLNQRAPDIVVKKRERGGLRIESTVPLTRIDEPTLKAMLKEYGVVNAEVTLRENITLERLVDFLAGNRAYILAMIVINKLDAMGDKLEDAMMRLRFWDPVAVSSRDGTNIEELRDIIHDKLRLISVYLKPRGGDADRGEPMVLREGVTVGELCEQLHRDFVGKFKHAMVWGPSAKFPGQKVGMTHVLKDGDEVSVAMKR